MELQVLKSKAKSLAKKAIIVPAVLALSVTAAHAGTDTTFDDISMMISDWSKGSLGKTLALATFVVGIGMGVIRQSVMAAAVGVGSALVLNYGPTVIDTTFTALI